MKGVRLVGILGICVGGVMIFTGARIATACFSTSNFGDMYISLLCIALGITAFMLVFFDDKKSKEIKK